MKSCITFVLAMVGALNALAAQAQVRSYHHHSTAFGDAWAGMAEYRLADGLYARNWAEGYRHFAVAERELAALEYEWREQQHHARLERLEYNAAKRDGARDRQKRRVAEAIAAAESIPAAVQSHCWHWPEALQLPEYAATVEKIEALLHDWPADGGQVDLQDRRMLSAMAIQLRHAVAFDRDRLSFAERVRTVKVLKSLQLLADVSDDHGRSLASR
jgi:hypothetical protein